MWCRWYATTYCYFPREKKDEIDRDHPNSYHKESAIHYGSNPAKKNWYICPTFWCIKCEISLSRDELKTNNGKCVKCGGTIIKDHKKQEENETILFRNSKYFTDNKTKDVEFDGDSDKVIKVPYTQFNIDKDKSMDSCVPCCGKKFNTPGENTKRNICDNIVAEK